MRYPLMLTGLVLALIIVTWAAVNYDQEILSAMRQIQNPALDLAMLLVTSAATLYIGVPIILLAMYFTRHKKALWDLIPALAIGMLVTFLLKALIGRPRPEDIFDLGFLVSASFYSFPSDHTSTAFIMFGVLGHHIKKYKLWFYLLAFLVALSRIYLGAHFPTDVLAGAFIGILVSQAVMRYRIGNKVRKALTKR